MKKVYFLVFLVLLSFNVFAKAITEDKAITVAINFMSSYVINPQLKLSHTAKNANGEALYYVFNLEKQVGFVIVTADDSCLPIIGYSTESNFVAHNLPVQLEEFLATKQAEITAIKQQKLTATAEIIDSWQDYTQQRPLASRLEKTEGVSPLTTTKWGQSAFFNELCPIEPTSRQRTITGCVATAMAQLMKYHKFPQQGQNNNSYVHNQLGSLSVDFSKSNYAWELMPNTVVNRNLEVAKLMYDCGVSVNMNYGVSSSAASVSVIQDALSTYFKYDIRSKLLNKTQFTKTEWFNLLKNELDNKRPILYIGYPSNETLRTGHVWICDGYDDNNMLHMNWGWTGTADGYYNIRSLNTLGNTDYTRNQAAIINLMPSNNNSPIVDTKFSTINISNTILDENRAMTISLSAKNDGNVEFKTFYIAVLYDSAFRFVRQVGELIRPNPLAIGASHTITISDSKMKLAAGKYNLYVFSYDIYQEKYKPINSKVIDILVKDIPAELAMASSINTNGQVYTQQAVKVDFSVVNTTNTKFEGEIALHIYAHSGDLITEIGKSNTVTIDSKASMTLSFTTPKLDLEDNYYILQPVYKAKGATTFTAFAASTPTTSFQNLLYLILTNSFIPVDKYEVNDTYDKASNLAIDFANDSSVVIQTDNATLHTTRDVDYYAITLPKGFNYEITPRVHDKDNSTNGVKYSADVLLSHSLDNYTNQYDVSINERETPIVLSDGGKVQFKVTPYFIEDWGTYQLSLQIKRFKKAIPMGIADEEYSNSIQVYPNPTANLLYINFPVYAHQTVRMMSVLGQEITIQVKQMTDNTIEINTANIESGVYYLQITEANKIAIKKIVVSK